MAETRTSNTAAAAGDGEYYTLEELTEFFRFKKGRDSPSEARNALLVIVALITTVTYQAALSPPGGLWQETKVGVAGKTILGTGSLDYGFIVFLVTNTAGFFCSIFMIEILTEGFPMRLELGCTIVALGVGYNFAMVSILPAGKFANLFIVCSIFFPLFVGYAAKKGRKALIRSRQGHDTC